MNRICEQNIYSLNFNEFMQKGQIANVGIVRLRSCLDHVFCAVSHLKRDVDNVDIQKKANLYRKTIIFISINNFYRKFHVVYFYPKSKAFHYAWT